MKKFVFAGMVLVAIGMIASFVTGKDGFSFGAEKKIDAERQIDSDGINQVEAVIDVGDIMVEPSPDDQIYVELHYKEAGGLNLEVEENDGCW